MLRFRPARRTSISQRPRSLAGSAGRRDRPHTHEAARHYANVEPRDSCMGFSKASKGSIPGLNGGL